jgi:hypothetical protein
MVPLLLLSRLSCPDQGGRLQERDVLSLSFDYGGAVTAFDDERQFVRADGPVFVRRDRTAEAAAIEELRQAGLVQMRIAATAEAKGRVVFLFRGADAAARWQAFTSERVPLLEAVGWQTATEDGFGPKMVEAVGSCDMRIADADDGGFSVDLGIELDGVRVPLLPILLRLHETGGMETARIVDDQVLVSLDDGRLLRLPAERTAHLLAVVDELVETARRRTEETLVLDVASAASVVDLEGLVTPRWVDAAAIAQHVTRFRVNEAFPEVAVPPAFTAKLREYQQHGVNWLQHLRASDVGGLLADDMGLGKTAQTIAHISIEHAAGR